ncbi:MAG: arsenate reductase ArsC, partial [Chlorobiaceae bacterium]|nr:arsenate reductase ArsC [Chlorobiaceae bacterium]
DGNRYYWPLDDPAAATGGVDEQRALFRQVRDELQQKIGEWVNGLRV